ncbi:hypothetical protein GUH30_06940 [Xanthomonas citri pv. citri]|nr:hypothetical protein [Xanthomonas citri pv. citri]
MSAERNPMPTVCSNGLAAIVGIGLDFVLEQVAEYPLRLLKLVSAELDPDAGDYDR